MKKIGLYFGSFNPIHLGHLIITDYFVHAGIFDEVRLVVSPHNPLKNIEDLAPEADRATMCNLAIEGMKNVSVSTIEFDLPKPSYTITTLKAFQEKEADSKFSLIIGEDSLVHFERWKDYDKILSDYEVFVFPRVISEADRMNIRSKNYPVKLVNAPIIEISSTSIRSRIKEGREIRHFVTEDVRKYLEKTGLYR
jgi:nicotinate-nucleotide adenylyltransferase